MSDLISRQAVIDRINKQREHLHPDTDTRDFIGNCAYNICIEFIERLPSAQTNNECEKCVFSPFKQFRQTEQSEQQWIPCSERLPEKGKVVLITNDKGNVRCGQYRGVWSFYERPTEWKWRGNTVETVIAWRYLPEPYKAESEG